MTKIDIISGFLGAADKSRSRELGGVGLGLAFVREIVSVHDGSICIKSGKTGGTIFEVTFTQHSM